MMHRLRSQIKKHLPPGYTERFLQGTLINMIPLTTYPKKYNGQPLMLAALTSQNRFVTLCLLAVYGDKALEKWSRQAYAASG